MAFQESPKFHLPRRDVRSVSYTLNNPGRINELVERIKVDGPKGFIKPSEFNYASSSLDVNALMDNLPQGIEQEDLIGMMKLAMLTECATETYANEIEAVSVKHDQPWLGDFVEVVWKPDEMSHRLPYKSALMRMGFSEEELDREMAKAQTARYTHLANKSPIYVTSFGMYQEGMTDYWHGLIRTIMHPTSPRIAHDIGRVKQRETLHERWYADMTALQLEDNPSLITHTAEAIEEFEMPGNEIVPDLQGKVGDWLSQMGSDFSRVKRDLVVLTSKAMGNPQNAGRLIMELADQQGIKLGPFSPGHMRAAVSLFGGEGAGILGEAMLESVGVTKPFKEKDKGPVGRIRGVIRSWTASKIDAYLSSAFQR